MSTSRVLYSLSVTGKMTTFVLTTDVLVYLLPGARQEACGTGLGPRQPRYSDPSVAYALYDTAKHELTYCRVPFRRR